MELYNDRLVNDFRVREDAYLRLFDRVVSADLAEDFLIKNLVEINRSPIEEVIDDDVSVLCLSSLKRSLRNRAEKTTGRLSIPTRIHDVGKKAVDNFAKTGGGASLRAW